MERSWKDSPFIEIIKKVKVIMGIVYLSNLHFIRLNMVQSMVSEVEHRVSKYRCFKMVGETECQRIHT